MGTDLHHRVHFQFRQGFDAVPERDGRPRMAPPVGCVHARLLSHRLAADVADQRNGQGRRIRKDFRRGGFEFVQYGFDQGAVVGGTAPQANDFHLLGLESGEHRFELFTGPADHLLGAVVHGDAEFAAVRRGVLFGHGGGDPVRGREYGRHPAVASRRTHQRAPRGRIAQPFFESESARGLGRRYLAETVADDDIGPYVQALPQRDQGAFERIDGGLRPRRLVEQSVGLAATEHHVQQRDPAIFGQQPVAAVQNRAEYGFAFVERAAHAGPLTGLAGENEGQFAARARLCDLVRVLLRCPLL